MFSLNFSSHRLVTAIVARALNVIMSNGSNEKRDVMQRIIIPI